MSGAFSNPNYQNVTIYKYFGWFNYHIQNIHWLYDFKVESTIYILSKRNVPFVWSSSSSFTSVYSFLARLEKISKMKIQSINIIEQKMSIVHIIEQQGMPNLLCKFSCIRL